MNRKFRNSIFSQLIFLIIIVVLVPLVFLGYSAYSSYKSNIETKIISNNYDMLHQVDLNINRVLTQINFIINTYNNNEEIETYLTEEYSSDYDKIKSTQVLEETLVGHLSSINWIDCNIILLGENKNIFTTSNTQPRLSSTSIMQSYWYQKGLAYNNPINWFVFEKSYFTSNSNDAMIVATKTLVNHATRKPYGVIIIEINEEFFYSLYKDTVNPYEVFMIRDAEGNIITTSDRRIAPSLDPETNSIPIERENLIRNYRYNNNLYMALNKSSTISDWTITKLIPTSTINKEINTLQYNLVFVYIACIILVLIGVFITALRLYNPIYSLTNKLRAQLITPKKTIVENPYAFQNILVGYELLIEQVDDTVEHLIQENEARRRTELHALKMQINPHFLYNTLNSIKCLVWTDNSLLIEPTITALVKILQQTLSRKDELTTLEQELENIKNYIYIQNVRTDNNITITYDVKKAYYNVKIPPLTLQPIVENAIFHGIEPKGIPGILSISAFKEEDDLYIEILDNGSGMSKDQLIQLSDPTLSAKKTGFTSIGLDNVKERLKLYYGDHYGIQIKSKEGLGTSILVKIKFDIGEDIK